MLWNCLRPFIWSTNNTYAYAIRQVQHSSMSYDLLWKNDDNHLLIVQFFAEGSCFLHLDHLVLPVVEDKVRMCYIQLDYWMMYTLMNTPSERSTVGVYPIHACVPRQHIRMLLVSFLEWCCQRNKINVPKINNLLLFNFLSLSEV